MEFKKKISVNIHWFSIHQIFSKFWKTIFLAIPHLISRLLTVARGQEDSIRGDSDTSHQSILPSRHSSLPESQVIVSLESDKLLDGRNEFVGHRGEEHVSERASDASRRHVSVDYVLEGHVETGWCGDGEWVEPL